MSEHNNSPTVLNAHVGLTNIIDNDTITNILSETFDKIASILRDHCGPSSGYAMIPDVMNPTAQPSFTKDGINIVRALDFVSPMEKFIKDTVAYIGSRIESTAGDATTSSMLISVVALKALATYVQESGISYREMSSNFDEFLKAVHTRIDAASVKSTDELKANIVYHQAYTSSHGDVELSRVVSELYAGLPESCWDHITWTREPKETDVKYSLKWEDSNYSAKGHIFTNKMYNDVYGHEYNCDDCKVIIIPHQMISDSMDFVNLRKYITEAIETNTKTVICVENFADGVVRNQITELLSTDPNDNVAIFYINVAQPTFNDMASLIIATGSSIELARSVYVFIDNCKVRFTDGCFEIWGIGSDYTNGSLTAVDDPTSDAGLYIRAIDDLIAYQTQGHASASVDNVVADYRRMRNNIVLERQATFVIGGSSYDNEAAVDVVQDAMKAARAVIKEGVTLGGYNTLLSVLLDYLSEDSVTDTQAELTTAFILGIQNVRDAVGGSNDKCYSFDKDSVYKYLLYPERFDIDGSSFSYASNNTGGFIYDVLTDTITSLYELNQTAYPVITQPASVDKALISRFGEVAIKFLFVNKIIIPNGVMVNSVEKK